VNPDLRSFELRMQEIGAGDFRQLAAGGAIGCALMAFNANA